MVGATANGNEKCDTHFEGGCMHNILSDSFNDLQVIFSICFVDWIQHKNDCWVSSLLLQIFDQKK